MEDTDRVRPYLHTRAVTNRTMVEGGTSLCFGALSTNPVNLKQAAYYHEKKAGYRDGAGPLINDFDLKIGSAFNQPHVRISRNGDGRDGSSRVASTLNTTSRNPYGDEVHQRHSVAASILNSSMKMPPSSALRTTARDESVHRQEASIDESVEIIERSTSQWGTSERMDRDHGNRPDHLHVP